MTFLNETVRRGRVMAAVLDGDRSGSCTQAPAAVSLTPANIGDAKMLVTAYHDGGTYEKDLEVAAAPRKPGWNNGRRNS